MAFLGLAPRAATAAQPAPTYKDDRLFVILAAALIGGIMLAYSNHFNNGFHFDDDHTIVQNLYIRDLRHVGKYFTDAGTFSVIPSNRGYRPLVTLSLAIDYSIGGGLKPAAFHASQFASLLVTGVLLFFLYRTLLDATNPHPWNRYAALFGAALFCIHTANTETVNYIIARSDLLSTLWVAAAFLLYTKLPAWRRYQLYLVPMVFGALCKPSALMFAPTLLVYLILFEADLSAADLLTRRGYKRAVQPALRAVPAFVATAGLWVVLNTLQEQAGGETILGGEQPYPIWDYLITQTTAYVHYIRLFFWPVGLLADTEQKALSDAFDPRILGSVLFLCALACAAWRASRRRQARGITLGLAWFVLALLPTSSLIPLSQIVSEHRIFFPYVGLMLAVVARAMTWISARPERAVRLRRARQGLACGCLVFVLLGLGTYRRNEVWRTDESLWRDVTAKEPQNARAWNNYGLIFLQQGQYAQARKLFARSAELNPQYRIAQINLGITEDQLGHRAEAERHFKEGIRLFEQDPDTHYYYARWLLGQRRFGAAVAEARRAVAIAPQSVKNRQLLMKAYAGIGDRGSLCALVQESLALLSDNAETMGYRRTCAEASPFDEDRAMQAGVAALYQGNDPAAAVVQFQKVLEHNASHYGATYQLATALDAAGQASAAHPLWEKVLQMAESYKDTRTADTARARLARADAPSEPAAMQAGLDALYKRHDPAAAVVEFRQVLELNPTHYGATYQLATALDRAGRSDEARPLWEKMLAMAETARDKATADMARARLRQRP